MKCVAYNKDCGVISDDIDIELRLARFENLMDRRPLLLNSVLLRQNPHNVHEWLKRVELFKGKNVDLTLNCLSYVHIFHEYL